MAITATLILSTFTMATDAFGDVFDEPGTYAIKTNAGDFTCTTPGTDSCGAGTAKARFQLLVTEVDETLGISTGFARGLWEAVPEVVAKIILKNSEPLSFTYDANNGVLTMTGEFVHSDGAKFTYDARGNITESDNGKDKIKFDEFELTNQDNGNVISVEELKGSIAIVDPADGYRNIKITAKGPATCEINNDDCGTGEMKTNASLVVTGIDENSETGIAKLQTSVTIPGKGTLKLISDGLPFAYVPNGAHMIIQGDVMGKKGITGQIEMSISNIDFESNTGDCSTTLRTSNGATFERPSSSCGIVLSPIN